MSAEVFQKINELLSKGEKFAVATIVNVEGSSPRGAGAKMIIRENGDTFGSIGGDCAERAVVDEALNSIMNEESKTLNISLEEEEEGGIGMKCGGEIEVSIEIVEPTPNIIIIGGGGIASKVAELGDKTGFSVKVIDPFAEKTDFPNETQVIDKSVEEGLSKISINQNSYVVIITRHKYDIPALKGVLGKDAKYIGLMGSQDRVKSQFKELQEDGFSREELSRVHAPVGLEIGAETPEEIAVSIIAEIIKVRRISNDSGENLKISF
ncbi:MAG: XdhC family protein [Hadesarchaea archaeon]|nr:XdhC family protein [Hadesarchaea archaeon]